MGREGEFCCAARYHLKFLDDQVASKMTFEHLSSSFLGFYITGAFQCQKKQAGEERGGTPDTRGMLLCLNQSAELMSSLWKQSLHKRMSLSYIFMAGFAFPFL